jgi:hypothetical protein
MKKLYERLIMAGGIGALVAIFFYQVAYATNESSYQFGYRERLVNTDVIQLILTVTHLHQILQTVVLCLYLLMTQVLIGA